MRLRLSDGAASMKPANGPDAPLLLDVEYTLCDLRDRPAATSALGRARKHQSGDLDGIGGQRFVVSTELIEARLPVTRGEIFAIDEDDPQQALLMPLLAAGLAAIDAVGPDIGWECFVVGSDMVSSVLAHLGRLAGARRVVRLSWSQLDFPAAPGPGETVFLVSGADNQSINGVVSLVPEGSTVMVLGSRGFPPEDVNFYSGVHRKNLRLLGLTPRVTLELARRSSRFLTSRLGHEIPEIPLVKAHPGDEVELGDSDWVVLEWV